jgi:hypothetical protein
MKITAVVFYYFFVADPSHNGAHVAAMKLRFMRILLKVCDGKECCSGGVGTNSGDRQHPAMTNVRREYFIRKACRAAVQAWS